MGTASKSTEEITRDTVEALERASRGERDPVRTAKSLEEMNLMREEIRKRVGTVDVAELIRDSRD
jgi:hypothetical protein